MTDRYVYLYRITLSKEGEDPLYYFGIRFGFKGRPEDDDYMGSPLTHKDLWEDPSYTKTKDILQIGTFSNQEELAEYGNAEIQIIKEAWDKYGLYSKGGRCLNAQAGRVFIHTPEVRKEIARKQSEYWTGNPLHPMKRPEHRKRKSEQMKKLLKEHPELNANNRPGVKEKQRERLLRDNPMHRPEIAAKVTGENNHMYGKKHTDENKKKISEATKRYWSDPEYRNKQSEIVRNRWQDEDFKRSQSEVRKKRWQERKNDPIEREKIKQACQKGYITRMKNKQKKMTNSLENYFE